VCASVCIYIRMRHVPICVHVVVCTRGQRPQQMPSHAHQCIHSMTCALLRAQELRKVDCAAPADGLSGCTRKHLCNLIGHLRLHTRKDPQTRHAPRLCNQPLRMSLRGSDASCRQSPVLMCMYVRFVSVSLVRTEGDVGCHFDLYLLPHIINAIGPVGTKSYMCMSSVLTWFQHDACLLVCMHACMHVTHAYTCFPTQSSAD
jgi:hypothetical protein